MATASKKDNEKTQCNIGKRRLWTEKMFCAKEIDWNFYYSFQTPFRDLESIPAEMEIIEKYSFLMVFIT